MTLRLPAACLAVAAVALTACGTDAPAGSPDASALDAPQDAPQDVPADASVSTVTDGMGTDGNTAPVCTPLTVQPAALRLATGMGGILRALGGSGGGALFAPAVGAMVNGAMVTAGGGVVAGPGAARFDVVATDVVCGAHATASVEVVGPFTVVPSVVRLPPSRTVHFTASGNLGTVHWDLLLAPPGGNGTLDGATGIFTAGTTVGTYDLRATDTATGIELPLRVDVAATSGFAARPSVVLVPTGRTVTLGFTGGSGVVDAVAAVSPGAPGGTFTSQGATVVYSAVGAHPGTVTVTGTDRYTGDHAEVKLVVGQEIAPAPVARGQAELNGDVALGDIDHDGRTDLVVGQGPRNGQHIENGALLVYRGQSTGGFSTAPDQVIEGLRDYEHFASFLQTLDADGDGITDVVAGSPEQGLGHDGQGTLSFFLGSSMGLVTPAERQLAGETNGDHFGTSWQVADLDADGAMDVIVAAPSATSPFQRTACANAGRAYVFFGLAGRRGLFEPMARQIIELTDRLDDTDGPGHCHLGGADAGRGMTLIDMDMDGHADLVIGAPGPAGQQPVGFYGSVLVYRGVAHGAFEATPAWVIHPGMSQRPAQAHFGFGVDSVPVGHSSVLVVRSPTYAQSLAGTALSTAGALWVFAPGSLGPRAADGMSTRVVLAGSALRFVGAASDGMARSSAVGDVDGDGTVDYVVGGASGTVAGAIEVFSTAALTGTAPLTPTATVHGVPGEFMGARLAVGPAVAGMASTVASWSAYANTTVAQQVGLVRYVTQGPPAGLSSRWMAATTLDLQANPAADHTGVSLAFGAVLGGRGDLVVGSPGAHSPALPAMGSTPAVAAGATSRVGGFDVFPAAMSASAARYWTNRSGASLGASSAVLDFNGDGRMDLALADPYGPSGGTDVITSGMVANPMDDPCLLRVGTTVTTASRGDGLVRIYLQQPDGTFAERFWVWSRETVPTGGSPQRTLTGYAMVGGFDANGDGLQDLLIGRPRSGAVNGAEVVLGRAPSPTGRITVVCGDPATAPWWPTATVGFHWGQAVAAVGDLDGDHCDETAVSVEGVSAGTTARGISIRYGFGARCAGHTSPFELMVVANDAMFNDNVAGDATTRANDTADSFFMGFGNPIAGGDVTGDHVPDVVFRDGAINRPGYSGPAVEVLSGAWLNALCPDRVCAPGLAGPFYSDGDYHVVALRTVPATARMLVFAPNASGQLFGTCLATADLDGDGVRDLLVGGPDDSTGGAFAGALLGYHGGFDQAALTAGPWLLAVGDSTEHSQFGAACAAQGAESGAGAWVAAGAPLSAHRGAETGAAYRWRIDP